MSRAEGAVDYKGAPNGKLFRVIELLCLVLGEGYTTMHFLKPIDLYNTKNELHAHLKTNQPECPRLSR